MDKVQAILNAAIALFASRGFDHTPVADIAEKAGVSSGTVIYYFKSKESLLRVLVWNTLNSIHKRTRKATLNAVTGLDGVKAFIISFFEALEENPEGSLIFLKNRRFEGDENALSMENIEALQKRYLEMLSDQIQRGINDGSIATVSVHDSTRGILAQVLGSAWLCLFHGSDIGVLRNEAVLTAVARLTNPQAVVMGTVREQPDADS